MARSIAALALVLVASGAAAQTASTPTEPGRTQVGFRGAFVVPLGAFAERVGASGGLSGDLTYRPGSGPLRVGGGLGVLWYGLDHRRTPLSGTIPDVLVDVTTSSGILTVYGSLRGQPASGRWRPYVEALAGFNMVFTQTSVDLDDRPFSDYSPTTTNARDFAPAFGVGGGVLVHLSSWSSGQLSLEVGTRFVFGGTVRYLTEPQDRPIRGVVDLIPNQSRTDVATFSGGLALEF